MVLLSQFALESVFARSRTIELPHDKAVFLNEVEDSLILVRNPMEPFMLVNVALDNVYLSIQNIMEMFAFVEHDQSPPAASSGVSSSLLGRHSVLDTESSRVLWIQAFAGMTTSRQAAGNAPQGIQTVSVLSKA